MTNDILSKKFEEVTGLNFSDFYSNYKPKLIWYLTKYTKDQNISADFADDAFIQALLKIDNYNSDKSQIHTWIYKIAENLVKKEHKDKQRLSVVSMDKQNDDNLSISGFISNTLIDDNSKYDKEIILYKKAELVKDAIYKLPEKYKRVMVLRELENKAYLDIAELCKKKKCLNIINDIVYLDEVNEFDSLYLKNYGNEVNTINIICEDYNGLEYKKEYIINPNDVLFLSKNDFYIIKEVEILCYGKMKCEYEKTTNLSTIKSQISKGRQLLQSMLYKKFKLLDEHGF